MILEVIGFLILCILNVILMFFSAVTITNLGFGDPSFRQKICGILMLLLSFYFWGFMYNMLEITFTIK